MMKPRDKVMIYEDPITCKKPEGTAVLLTFRKKMPPEGELWKVRFLSDGFVTERTVNKTNHEIPREGKDRAKVQ